MRLEEYQNLPDDELLGIIGRLKAESGALFLVHNYQRLEVQRLADHIGDSLALAHAAACSRPGLIVFCGVHFMDETAKILNPQSRVLLPDPQAGCPMADMVTPQDLRQARADQQDLVVVAYVNTSAAVKAESHICCTSSNAVRVVNSIPTDRRILFVPDRNLGSYVSLRTGREIRLWPGYCSVHHRITAEEVERARAQHPQARLIVHPECRPEVVALADAVASTSGMVKAVEESGHIQEWIIGTELGLVEQLAQAYPRKRFYPLSERAICQNMKRTTLAKIAWSLENSAGEITVPQEISERARLALERMLELG